MLTDKVYLVGFMGSGKTTLATALGNRLNWRVEDSDRLVERHESMSVADIFAEYGERHFREAEHKVLNDLLPVRRLVVATGGGTFVSPENRALINLDGVSIWLDVSLGSIIERLPMDGRRPLASDRSNLKRLFHSRRSAYERASMRIDADRTSTSDLVEQVVSWLGTRPLSNG